MGISSSTDKAGSGPSSSSLSSTASNSSSYPSTPPHHSAPIPVHKSTPQSVPHGSTSSSGSGKDRSQRYTGRTFQDSYNSYTASEVHVMMSPSSSPLGKTPGGFSALHSDSVPTVFSWTHGGRDVYITGSFNNWKEKIPLNLSEKDFTVIQSLPPGNYQYKFIVDGKWMHSQEQPVTTDVRGNVNNFIEVKRRDPSSSISYMKASSSPPGSYSTLIPEQDYQSQKTPVPTLPPHLRRALLNTTPSSEDPTLLPSPHHVMLNHLYSLPKNDSVTILGVTHRYRSKFITTVLYKPIETKTEDDDKDDFIQDIEL